MSYRRTNVLNNTNEPQNRDSNLCNELPLFYHQIKVKDLSLRFKLDFNITQQTIQKSQSHKNRGSK